MELIIKDEALVWKVLDQRRRLGIDVRDEVWKGVYHVVPVGNREHGRIQAVLIRLFADLADPFDLEATGPVNLGTEDDYRIPDAALLPKGQDRETVWIPRASVVAEVLSPGDETYQKFPHYYAHGVLAIIVVDPAKQKIERWQALEQSAEYRLLNRNAGGYCLGFHDLVTLSRALGWGDPWDK